MVLPAATQAGDLLTLSDGGVSRVAKGADCKSAALWLRRFESCLPHQPSLASRATARRARRILSKPKRAKAVSPNPESALTRVLDVPWAKADWRECVSTSPHDHLGSSL